MSIKGKGEELFVGKKKSNILSANGKRTVIPYHSLKEIEYCLATHDQDGLLDFRKNKFRHFPFAFSEMENDKIQRTIVLIRENNPHLTIKECQISEPGTDLNDNQYSTKSHFLAGLLCLLIGRTGAHRFYVGKYISGSIYLAVYLFPRIIKHSGFAVAWYILLASWLLVIIDLLMICYNLFEDSNHKVLHPDYSRLNPRQASTVFFVAMIYYLICGGFINYAIALLCLSAAIFYLYKYYKL